MKQVFFVSSKIIGIFIALSAISRFDLDLFIRQIECYSSITFAFISFLLNAEEKKAEENSILWQ
jgi:hypothetical protein